MRFRIGYILVKIPKVEVRMYKNKNPEGDLPFPSHCTISARSASARQVASAERLNGQLPPPRYKDLKNLELGSLQ